MKKRKAKKRHHPTLIELAISMPQGGVQKRYLTSLQFNGAIVAMDGFCFLGEKLAPPDDEEYARSLAGIQQLAWDFTAWGKAMDQGVSTFIISAQHGQSLLWACNILSSGLRGIVERGKVDDPENVCKVIVLLDTLKRMLQ